MSPSRGDVGARLVMVFFALAASMSVFGTERHNIVLFVPEVLSAASADDGHVPTLTRLRNEGVNFLESHSRLLTLAKLRERRFLLLPRALVVGINIRETSLGGVEPLPLLRFAFECASSASKPDQVGADLARRKRAGVHLQERGVGSLAAALGDVSEDTR